MLRGSVDGGLRNPPVRWLMLSAPFTAGVGIFAFYALQPYLLQLYGDPTAYGIAGLAAAIVAAAQITGGLIVPRVRRLFRRRTDALLVAGVATVVLLAVIGLLEPVPRGPRADRGLGADLRDRRRRCGRRTSTGSSRPSSARRSCRSTT